MRWFEREQPSKIEIYTNVISRIPEGRRGLYNATEIFERCVTEQARAVGINRNNLAKNILNPASCIERNTESPKEYIRSSPSPETCNGCPFKKDCVIIRKK